MIKAPLLVLVSGCIALASTACYADDDSKSTHKALIAESHGDAPAPPKFTDEQLDKIHAIKTRYADGGTSRMADLHKLHRQIGDALSEVTVDKPAVMTLQAKLNDLEGQAANERTQMMMEIHDVLTPEQRQQMRRHMLMHDMHGFGGPGMGHPGGPPGMMPGFGPPPFAGPGGPGFHHGPPGPGCEL